AHAEEARTDGREAAADADEVRQVEVLRPQLGGDEGAERGVLETARRDVAGVQLIGGPLVLALAVGHGPDKSDVLHRLRDVGPVLGDLNAADGGVNRLGWSANARARLGIECLELARAAAHEHQDARHAALAQLLRVQGHGVLEAEAEAGRAGGHAAQEGPPAQDAVAARTDLNERLKGHRRLSWFEESRLRLCGSAKPQAAGSLPLRLELGRVDQRPEDVLERVGPVADLLDVAQALLLLAVGRLAGQSTQVDRLQGFLVGGVRRQDAAQHGGAGRAEALVDLRVVHQDQRLRDAALDIVRLQRGIETELLLELSLQPETAAERPSSSRPATGRPAAPGAHAAQYAGQRVPQRISSQSRRIEGRELQVVAGRLAQARLPLIRVAVQHDAEQGLYVVLGATVRAGQTCQHGAEHGLLLWPHVVNRQVERLPHQLAPAAVDEAAGEPVVALCGNGIGEIVAALLVAEVAARCLAVEELRMHHRAGARVVLARHPVLATEVVLNNSDADEAIALAVAHQPL